MWQLQAKDFHAKRHYLQFCSQRDLSQLGNVHACIHISIDWTFGTLPVLYRSSKAVRYRVEQRRLAVRPGSGKSESGSSAGHVSLSATADQMPQSAVQSAQDDGAPTAEREKLWWAGEEEKASALLRGASVSMRSLGRLMWPLHCMALGLAAVQDTT